MIGIFKPEGFGLPNEWYIYLPPFESEYQAYPEDIQLIRELGYTGKIDPPFGAHFLGTFTKDGLKMRRMPGNPWKPFVNKCYNDSNIRKEFNLRD